MKKFAAFAAAFAVAFNTTAFAAGTVSPNNRVISLYNDRNGLPTGEANAVVQTPDGYIWIGSYAGLIRYDGTTFRNFSEEGILPSSTVRSLFVDSEGTLWVGSNDMGVFMMTDDGFVQPEGQPADSLLCIRGFAEDGENVYAASSTGIAEITGGVLTLMGDAETAQTTFYSTAVDEYGRIWGSVDSGAYIFDAGGSVISYIESGLVFGDDAEIYSVCSGADGAMWIGSDQSLAARVELLGEGLDGSDFSVTTYETGDVVTINSMTALSDGGIMLNALHGFGIIGPDGEFTEFANDSPSSVVNSCMDYEGNIWLASSASGIIKYSVGFYSYPAGASGLTDQKINTIASSNGSFYLGTDKGLLIYDSEWEKVENELTEMLSGARVRHTVCDSDGCIWVASYTDTPVIRYNPLTGEITSWGEADGLSDTTARTITCLSDGTIAAGMQGGVNMISTEGNVTHYGNFGNAAILCMTEMPDGSLLVGTDGGGVYRLNDGVVSQYGDGKFDSGVVLRIVPDSQEGCYYISTGSGLAYFDGSSYKMLNKLHKQAGNIFDIYLREDKLYFLQNSGITVISREDVLADNGAKGISYGFEHGLSGSLFANTWNWLSPDGELYMSTQKGISIYSFDSRDETLPKLAINSITVDNAVYEGDASIDAPSSTRRISIDFAALSFTNATRLSFAYKLDGFDSEETVVSDLKSDTVSYTNLPGGSYTFTVRVFLTNSPEQSAEYSVVINKEQSLVEKSWFRAVVILLGFVVTVSLTLLCLWARVKRIQRRQREYRDMLDQTLKTFAGIIDAKDKYTNGHSLRVARYSAELARRMGMTHEQQEHIYYVALLHDIGKIGIPDSILTKPGKLTDEERKIIQQHPAIGGNILKDFTAIKDIAYGAKYHHERYDGNGYNEGLKGEDIPLIARIIAVADTYDAMSSKRCYRNSMSTEYITNELKRVAGTQLDPKIVPYMLAMIEDGTAPITLTGYLSPDDV